MHRVLACILPDGTKGGNAGRTCRALTGHPAFTSVPSGTGTQRVLSVSDPCPVWAIRRPIASAPCPDGLYLGALTLHGDPSLMGSQASSLVPCLFQDCCLAPDGGAPADWTLTPSPGELGSRENSGSSGAHLVQETVLLLPVGTIYHGTGKQYWVGKVQ